MPNRYNRDELIKIALDMAQVPNLKQHDCPNGVVQTDAYAVQWLQDIMDFWYHMVPFSGGVTDISLPIPALTTEIALPDDFILDVRNGYIIQRTEDVRSNVRLMRVPLQKWLNRDLYYQGQPIANSNTVSLFYMVQGRVIKVTPQNSVAKVARLWYYFLPPVLDSDDIPLFPSDYVLIEYVRIRALEWCGHSDIGTSQMFCDKIVGSMKSAGLMNEPEDDEIPFDTIAQRQTNRNVYSWMGPV